jgi:hypothetical protein
VVGDAERLKCLGDRLALAERDIGLAQFVDGVFRREAPSRVESRPPG